MVLLITNCELCAPKPRGLTSIAITGPTIASIGDIDHGSLVRSRVPVEVIDATGSIVAPGLIDPHEHLLGGSGEEGFSSQTPEITVEEIVTAGITSRWLSE